MNRITLVITTLMAAFIASGAFGADTVVNEKSGAEYKEGLAAYQEGDYNLAITHFVKAHELDERNVAAVFAHGLALLKQKDFAKAASKFEAVLDKEPDHEKAARMFPYALDKAGDKEEALAAYDRVIASHPDNAGLYWGKARVLIQHDNAGDAVPLLKKAVELEKKNPALYETLSIALYRTRQFKEALAANDNALALKPGDTGYLYFKAQVLSETGAMKDAYDTAKKVLAKNADHARARIIVADYKREQGMLDEALADYELAMKNIETRAYASHYIEVIKQQQEEEEIEREYQERLRKQQQ